MTKNTRRGELGWVTTWLSLSQISLELRTRHFWSDEWGAPQSQLVLGASIGELVRRGWQHEIVSAVRMIPNRRGCECGIKQNSRSIFRNHPDVYSVLVSLERGLRLVSVAAQGTRTSCMRVFGI
jgi:hypothetical protein